MLCAIGLPIPAFLMNHTLPGSQVAHGQKRIGLAAPLEVALVDWKTISGLCFSHCLLAIRPVMGRLKQWTLGVREWRMGLVGLQVREGDGRNRTGFSMGSAEGFKSALSCSCGMADLSHLLGLIVA